MRAFTWTAKRDGLLAELRRQGLSLAETARAIGCDVEHVKLRVRELGLQVSPPRRASSGQVATVPRPVGVRARRENEYQGTSGTARGAPGAASSGAAERATGGVPDVAAGTERATALRPRPMLIDLSRAPSSMEQQAAKWAGRA